MRLAAFVSPHGFGHAARTSAILRACWEQVPEIRFDLFTRVPAWFFEESIPGQFDYHDTQCDVGFVQRSALEIDLPGTLTALDAFLPFDPTEVRCLAGLVQRAGCEAVLCDISPLGIAVARAAGLRSILVENFTWDWLYEPYRDQFPGFRRHCALLRELFLTADHRVQTTPFCVPVAAADVVSPPVARPVQRSRAEVRNELGLRECDPLVLITLGGVPQALSFLPKLRRYFPVTFLITGASGDLRDGNLIVFDQATRLYMPDLMRASDAVVAKLGYGTVAEVWTTGKAMAYVARDFRESGPLKDFVDHAIPSFEIREEAFHRGDWLERVDELLALPNRRRPGPAGAKTVADFVLGVLARL